MGSLAVRSPGTVLFKVVTDRWTLTLKTKSQPLLDLRALRKVTRPASNGLVPSLIRCDAPGFREQETVAGKRTFREEHRRQPCVFENRTYLLAVEAKESWTLQDVQHPVLRAIGDAFDVDDRSCRGTIATGNDIGRFTLLVTTRGQDGQSREDRIGWEVWPLKLDYGRDLKDLTDAVEREYPLWLFRFLAPTDHEAGRSDRPQERFLLLWLKQFAALRVRFEKGVRTVIRSPHQRLDEHVRHLRADRIKGKISPRLQERIAQHRERPELRHRVESRLSSFDTAENRFVKHAVGQVAARLDQVANALATLRTKDGEARPGGVSEGFRSGLDSWRRTARSQGSDPLFRGVGDFEGLTQESLVLHNRAGYSAVYRSWLELRHYLEFFAKVRSTNIGMRQISELYELWCFLEVRRILTALGFRDESLERLPQMASKNALEKELENGFGAAFVLRHDVAGITVRLAHEPVFGRPKAESQGRTGVHSFTVSQKPDIVLEATWGEGEKARRLLWIFDAKYRIKITVDDREDERSASLPLVPPDALDQMHRYRDSLILLEQEKGKSRPVIGAYALYPGVFDQTNPVNPYAGAIREVGIGAFPLLPGGACMDGEGSDKNCRWLKDHLREALGLSKPHQEFADDHATLLAQENVRIPVTGLEYEQEDVLVVFLGRDRDEEYLRNFGEGTATCYHTRVEGGPALRRLERVRWLAAIDPVSDVRSIRGLYEVKKIGRSARGMLGREVTGARTPVAGTKEAEQEYQVLQLGNYRSRDVCLEVPPNVGGHWFRYASKANYDKANVFADLKPVRQLGS